MDPRQVAQPRDVRYPWRGPECVTDFFSQGFCSKSLIYMDTAYPVEFSILILQVVFGQLHQEQVFLLIQIRSVGMF